MVRGRLQVGGRRARGLRSPPEEPDGAHGPVLEGQDRGIRRPLSGEEEQARVRAGVRARAQLAISVHVHAQLRARERGPGEASARVVRGGDAPVAERAASDFLARVGGELKVTEPCNTA